MTPVSHLSRHALYCYFWHQGRRDAKSELLYNGSSVVEQSETTLHIFSCHILEVKESKKQIHFWALRLLTSTLQVTHKKWQDTHKWLTSDSQVTHKYRTSDSQVTHKWFTSNSQVTHTLLTSDSQGTHKWLTRYSHITHKWLTRYSQVTYKLLTSCSQFT